MSSTLGRRPSRDGQNDTLRSKKSESFMDKLSGTLTRKKKPQPEQQNEVDEENEGEEVELEGRNAINSAIIPYLAKDIDIDEGETRRFLTRDSNSDPKMSDLINLLVYWLNQELADERIVVRNVQEDLYDGQIIQRLIEKLAGIRIEVPEVTQSEEGQRNKLETVIATVNRHVAPSQIAQPMWTAEQIHAGDLVAMLHLLVAMALHFRAPIRMPENVVAKIVTVNRTNGHVRTENHTEQLTTTQTELGLKGERDAFDTLFDYGPDKLAHVKSSLLAFCNKHLNKINLEVNDLDSQFQDGVFLVLLMGLLEGYFVPLHAFHLQVTSYEEKVKNIVFAFKLMEEAGLSKPRSRPQDIANGDVKSTLRLLHLLFTKYKHV